MEHKKQTFSLEKAWRYFFITYEVVWNLFLIFFILILCLICFAVGLGAGYFASLVKDMPIPSYKEMKRDIYDYEETSHIYFANNVYLGNFRSDLEREEVKLQDVSPYVIKAITATEDEYFYEHHGVVPKAIIRALFQEATNSPLQTGGSTLTQQLVKNQILTNEVSFERKAKEILLALRLEKFFSKNEILEAYLNVVPFGRNASGRNIAGIQAAAQGVFGVDAKDLNLAQAAFLAGLPQSPFVYTPFTSDGNVKKDLSPALHRMKKVLNQMKQAGYISEKQYQEALQYDIAKHFAPPKPSPFEKYPWLTMEIEKRAKEVLAEVLAKKDGYTKEQLLQNSSLHERYAAKAEKQLRQNGYNIYTTIDKTIYDRMQKVVADYRYYGDDKIQYVKDKETGKMVAKREPVEVGAILIENSTGKIISFVGGRDYKREQLNHATQAYRSNGSTMKPLLVYAPAMEMGIVQPGSVIPDMPLRVNGYTPKNADGKTHGLVSARRALQYSYNIPAIRTYMKIMNQHPVEYLHKMGITSVAKTEENHIALAIGGTSTGVTVEENVNAYVTFANYGTFVDAYLIEKIVSNDGQVIYEHQSDPVPVFSPQTSYLMIDMMRDVIRGGTASSLRSYLKFQADWAGKTGTSENQQDSWFVATNPNVTFGVWMGYDTPAPLQSTYRGLSYSKRTQLLWAQLMNSAYDVNPQLIAPNNRFNMPGGIVRRAYCTVSGLTPSNACQKAGLVSYDLYNTKFTPKQGKEQYLIEGRFVEVNGKRYAALDTTPSEFVSSGVILNREVLKRWGMNRSSASEWNGMLFVNELKENGKIPAPPAIHLANGTTITWQPHSEHDVIGYRVYRTGQGGAPPQVAAVVKAGKTLSFAKLQPGATYYVTAVDISGKESAPSNTVAAPLPSAANQAKEKTQTPEKQKD